MGSRGRFVALASAFVMSITAASADAAVPTIVNNNGAGAGGWIQAQAGTSQANNRKVSVTFLVKHDASKTITGIAFDKDYNGTDNTNTITPSSVTSEYLGTGGSSSGTNKLITSIVRFSADPGDIGGYGCPFIGSGTRTIDGPLRFAVVDSSGARSAAVSETYHWVTHEQCTAHEDPPVIYDQVSQSATTTTPGTNVLFKYECDDEDTTGDDNCGIVHYRWRRLNDGAVSGDNTSSTNDNTVTSFNMNFPQRGIYVVEAYPCDDGNAGCDGPPYRYNLGTVQVDNSAVPTGSVVFSGTNLVTGTPNSVNAGSGPVTATATSLTDPGGGGGVIQVLDWDLDGDGTFERTDFTTTTGSGSALSTPALSAAQIAGTVNTTTPGLKTISVKAYDNGTADASGNDRKNATFTKQIRVNAIPVASPGSATTPEDTAKPVVLSATDSDNQPAALSYSIVSGPSHGTLSGTAPNLTYTPNANYNGSDSFTFNASDGPVSGQASATSNTATVSLTVTAVNDAPVAGDTSFTTAEDTPANFSVPAMDVDGDTLSVTTTTPAHGTVGGCTILTCTYTPNANYNGTDNFDYTVNDGHGGTATAHVVVTVTPVNDAPSANNTAATTAEDSAISIPVSATDIDGDSLAFGVQTAPIHGAVSCSGSGLSGTCLYTPGLNFNGADQFKFKVDDGHGGTSIGTVDVTVTAVNDAPIANPQTVTTPEESPLAITLSGSDVDGDTLTFSAAQPAHGVVTCTGSACTYTPDALFHGSDSFNFTADDGHGGTATATITITVTPVNHRPVADPQSVTTAEDTATAITLTGTDADLDPLTYTSTNPAHGTLSGIAPNLTYTPAANFNGSDSFDFTVDDGRPNGTATATVSITVSPVNDAPVAQAQSVALDEDTHTNITVVATDVDNDPLSYTFTQPANGAVSCTGDTCTYTPTHDYNGPDAFTFTADDGHGGTDTATVSITVNPVNDAPVTSDQSFSTDEDTPVSFDLTASDVDGDALTFHASAASHGSVVCSASGHCTYTPDHDTNGPDAFSFSVSDGTDTATATATIAVAPVNDAPVAQGQSVTTDEDTALGITLHATDVDGDTLSYSVTQPANGSVSCSGADCTYTPDANYNGPDAFTFTADDGNGATDTATISIGVNAVNDAPVAHDSSVTTDEDNAVATPITATDVDGDSLDYTITDAPNHGTLSGTAPDLTYTPFPNANGSDSFSYSVNDGNGGTATAAVSITINPVNDAPVAQAQSVTTDEDTPLTVTLSALDVDGDTLAYSVTQPGHGSVSCMGAICDYTPDANYNGSDAFTFTADDGNGGTDTATISITLNPVNDAPVTSDQSLTLDEDTTGTVTLTSSDVDGDTPTYTISAPASFGAASCTTAGVCTYTPGPNYNGSDSFSFNVDDGNGGTAHADVLITVTPVNDAPVGDPQSLTTDEDTPLGVTLSALDVDGDTLSYSVTQPGHGSVSCSGTACTYTPTHDYNGSDAFTFTVDDGNGGTDTATISIGVNAVNDAPVAHDSSVTTDEDNAVATPITATDVDGDSLDYTITDAPDLGTLSGTAPDLTYTPFPNANGSDSFSYSVDDGNGGTATATVSITINPVNDAPIVSDQSVSTDEDTGLVIPLDSFDVDGDTLSITPTTPGHGTVSCASATVCSYHPAQDYNGPDGFDVTIDDGNGGTDGAHIAINVISVNDAPVAHDSSVTTDEDNAVGTPITATDVDGDSLDYTITDAPDLGTLSGTAPDLTYTPFPNANGSDSFSYSVDDGNGGTATATVSITINPVNDAPVAQDQSVSTNEDTALHIGLVANDVDGDSLDYTVTQPGNGSVSCAGDSCTYTPNANYHGPDGFDFTVNDGNGGTDTAHVTINVISVNDDPVTANQSVTTNEDTAATFDLSASDVDGDTLSFHASPASNGSVVCSGDGHCTYTPDANYHGPDSFGFTVSDGNGGTASATVSITVVSVNDAPVAQSQTLSTDEDTALPVALHATDVDGDTLNYTVTQPSNGAVSCTGTACTYTPAANYHGPDHFTFTANDGQGGSDTATISITVNSVNDAPVTANRSVTTNEDTAVTTTLTATDVDGDSLTFSLSTPASHGTASCTTAGVCTYAPNANYNGPDSYTVAVSDGNGGIAHAVVSITVTPVNDAPTASPATVHATEDTPAAFSLVAADVDGDSLTYTVVPPSHGSITCSGASCTYTPAANYNGPDSTTFTVSDGHGGTVTKPITIDVAAVNDAPVAQNVTVTTQEETPAMFALIATDVDGDTLTYSILSGPAHGTLSCAGALCTYTPSTNYSGPDTILYKVTDPSGASSTARVDITVTHVAHATRLTVPPIIHISLAPLSLQIKISFEGTLVRASNGVPLPNETISFIVAGQRVCSAVTNAAGTARCGVSITSSLLGVVLSGGYSAVFDGDTDYLASSGSGLLLG